MLKKNNVPVCPYHFPIIYGLWMSLTCFWSDGCKICEGSVGVELCVALHPLVSGNVEDQLVKIVCFGSFWGVKFWRTIFKILHFSNSAFIEFIAFRQHGQEHLEVQTPTSTPSMKLNRMSSAVAGGRFLLPYIDIYWHISYIPQWSSMLIYSTCISCNEMEIFWQDRTASYTLMFCADLEMYTSNLTHLCCNMELQVEFALWYVACDNLIPFVTYRTYCG